MGSFLDVAVDPALPSDCPCQFTITEEQARFLDPRLPSRTEVPAPREPRITASLASLINERLSPKDRGSTLR